LIRQFEERGALASRRGRKPAVFLLYEQESTIGLSDAKRKANFMIVVKLGAMPSRRQRHLSNEQETASQ
jgi:hypothetical protein